MDKAVQKARYEIPECVPTKPGYLKVQLTFLTYSPKHIRSEILRSYGLRPPFPEDITIFIPEHLHRQNLTPVFQHLQQIGLIAPTSSLIGHRILEDEDTLAYVIS